MKTQLEPFSLELAAVFGTDNSQKRYIFIPRAAHSRGCKLYRPDKPIKNSTALAKIEAALDRLELGTFGLCTRCGDEINLKRLDRDPSVPRCQGCEDAAAARAR